MLYVVILIAALSIFIDQILKLAVVNTLDVGQTIPVIDGVFHFTYIQNFGAAFSILQNRQSFLILITALAMAVMAFIAVKNINRNSRLTSVSLALIVGGGIGNIIDRIRMGYVVDFFDFRLIDYPVFNFADCCVVVGAIMLVVAILLSERHQKKEN